MSVVICSFISVCVDITDNARNRENGTECILCMECVKNCPKNAL
ncbi:MAG: 4Fe-4S binding protein [Erysipelotrichaceae bacterium]